MPHTGSVTTTDPFLLAADLFDPPPPRHDTPADLAAELDPRYATPPHIALLAGKLRDTIATGGRLIVEAPPRHGKSETTSKWTPLWYLEQHPDRRVVLASYASTFAASWGRRVRNLATAHAADLQLRLASDSQSRSDWSTTRGDGGMLTVGVGGPITGRGADLLIIDDPIKNAAEAYSPQIRDSMWDWWTTTARTRLEPRGAIVIVMTRWHHDDLVGRLLAGDDDEHGDIWDVISLPAIAGPDDQLGREPGEPLWPQRYDTAALAKLRKAVGPTAWEALYQQQPTTDEGGIFPMSAWHWYDLPQWTEHDDGSCRVMGDGVVFQSWDMAFKGKPTSDFVIGQVWLRRGAHDLLLDQVRRRMSFDDTVRAVRGLKAKWPDTGAILIEDKANGPAVLSTLASSVRGLMPVEPDGGKEARAHAVSPFVHAGNVHLPSPQLAPWVDEFITEAARFPHGENDDQVDAMTQALNYELPGADDFVEVFEEVHISPV